MSDKTVYVSKGISSTSLLGCIFIVLKLTNYIDWSWWWVLAPFWLGWAIIIGLVITVFIIGILVAMFFD